MEARVLLPLLIQLRLSHYWHFMGAATGIILIPYARMQKSALGYNLVAPLILSCSGSCML